MIERKYLPTLADLIDRLSIELMKRVFIGGTAYDDNCDILIHDISLLLEDRKLWGREVYYILVLMLANRFIWENESAVRNGSSAGNRLRATHSINGVRNRAKNLLSLAGNERLDPKVDCLAADLPPEFGNWNVL